MPIKVYINQKPAGTLAVTQDGLYTVFEATANADGLVRLWVYGGGKSAYLGIMEPTDSGMMILNTSPSMNSGSAPQTQQAGACRLSGSHRTGIRSKTGKFT